jgi:hypothetical protein
LDALRAQKDALDKKLSPAKIEEICTSCETAEEVVAQILKASVDEICLCRNNTCCWKKAHLAKIIWAGRDRLVEQGESR